VNTWKVILATLVIFVAGVVTGGLLVSYSDRAQQKQRRSFSRENPNRPMGSVPGSGPNLREAQRPPILPNRLPHVLSIEFLQKLDSELHLTADQRERIEKIIIAGQQRNKELWERIAPELRREIAESQKRIREELTPEQRSRFEELMKKRPPRKADESVPPDRRSREQRDLRRTDPPREAPAPDAPPSRPPDNP
jgi:hypothetical protein